MANESRAEAVPTASRLAPTAAAAPASAGWAQPWLAWAEAWSTQALRLDVWGAAAGDAGSSRRRQDERLRALLAAAWQGSPLYRRLWGARSAPPAALAGLPVVDKPTLMAAFDDWVTDPALTLAGVRAFMADTGRAGDAFLGHYAVWESSGSRGVPGVFVQDAAALAVYDALEATRRAPADPLARWADPLYLGERIAFVGATDGHFATHASVQRMRRLAPWATRQWRSFSILQPLPALGAALDAFQPTIVATYPTAAALLAAEQRAGRLAIAPREVWTGGETLGPAVRGAVERAFGCTLRNSYGASEFLPIAWECPQHALHVNADWVILEPVDKCHQPVTPGTLSHTVLLTNLANRVQPLVRYDLGDRLRMPATPCRCGSALPVIEVLGRCDDVLQLRGRGGAPVALLPLAVSTVLEDDAGVFDFRLEQTGAASLRLRVAAADPACARQAGEVLRAQGARLDAAATADGVLRLLPHRDDCDGFFAVRWERPK